MLQAATRLFAHRTRIAFGALLLAIAGCAPNLPPPQPPSQAPAPAPQAPAAPLAPVDTSVKVGLLLPLSGQQAGLGRAMLQAAEMGLFEVGDERFTLLVEDTATAGGADSAARRLLADGAKVMLGPVFGTDTRKVAPIVQAARVPGLAFTNDKTVAQPGVYVLGVTPQAEVERVVSYAVSQGKRRFAILSPASPYGNIVSAAYRDAIVQAGGILAQMASYDPNSPDYTGTVERLGLAHQSQPFDALMLPEGGAKLRQLAPLLPAFQIDPRSVQMLGTGLWANDPALAQQAGPGIAVDFNSPVLTNPNGFAGTTGVFRLNQNGTVDRALAVIEVQPGGGYVRDPAIGTFAAAIN